MISGGTTEQLIIFCHVTGFTSDFLSFIVVEHVRFFRGVLQLAKPTRLPPMLHAAAHQSTTGVKLLQVTAGHADMH